MATQTLKVIYENGSFHPIGGANVPLAEGKEAEVVIEVEDVNGEAQTKPRVAGLHAGLVGWDPTFDDELPDSFWLGEE
ncbi:MAG TPA: antitoxin family protein [Abditibacterium sp.]|jgi:predicted DNA-binding antitoxin AbrB/MazE fold protein